MERIHTPKACWPEAQGRRNAATLGLRIIKPYNPNGVVPAVAATPMGLLVFVNVYPG